MKQYIKTLPVLGLAAFLVGCAATQTVIEHGKLSVHTQQSRSIFLDPIPQQQKTVFVSMKNNTDEHINITSSLKSHLAAQGYKISNVADKTHYLLQINILQIGTMAPSASSLALGGGFGSAIAGASAGTAIGALASQSSTGMIAGGLSGGVLGLAADALVKDVSYSMVTDVQITEHQKKSLKRYRTRIVSTAHQVNLKFKDAKPLLEKGLVNTITGIF